MYLGAQQNWLQLTTVNIDKKALDASGFSNRNFINKPVNIGQLGYIKERILNYYERNGYPFAAVFLDSIVIKDNAMAAALNIKKGPLYHIDSISIKGKVKISNSFLSISAFNGPTPLRYSTGFDNILLVAEIVNCFYKYISLVGNLVLLPCFWQLLFFEEDMHSGPGNVL